jgi:PIN domain nuclease of toxin-antitoxin system
MNQRLPMLLDTCAALWIAKDDPLSRPFVTAFEAALESKESVYVSPITAWELGLLASRGRLTGAISPSKIFQIISGRPGIVPANLTSSVLIDSSFLPGEPPNDPADRIIIATAREYGLCIVTRDRLILNYAALGHVQAIAC